ncbi:hypothetical protein [Limnoglobus roseus]|uniref:Uncharacterized protein n=1 Tax=Limnoglobus roseus TaxID=2598579 RepID=A0A5C1AQH9_9BACT|nr:hypothetical protein [Limnoglobus roseus]QEL20447.1 hypothetical protein PX52LOC_07545 [Limnoglobus roseus]
MSRVSVSATVRDILTSDITLTADEVIRKAKAMGLTASADAIRKSVHNQRGIVTKGLGTKPAPSTARGTVEPKATTLTAPTPSSDVTPTRSSDLASVLSNVALVNTVVGVCGGVAEARQVAEAVEACGGVSAFLQHLDLVAGIRGGAPR